MTGSALNAAICSEITMFSANRQVPRSLVEFAGDSPLEEAVRSEPVSEIGLTRVILDDNKQVSAWIKLVETKFWPASEASRARYKRLGKAGLLSASPKTADEFTVYKKDGNRSELYS